MAAVVIRHLSPDNQSLMPEILQRCTQMSVAQIEDGTRIEPNAVYVIRPGFTVTLADGVLHLGVLLENRGHRRPVDDFFRSLALEQKEKAIIVILSGTGTNGTAGAQAVKAAGGLCVAQDPETAEFPGMPRSLIHSGYADQVLPAEQIPRFLVDFVRHSFIQDSEAEAEPAEALQSERRGLAEVHALRRTRTGHDFRCYRKPTLLRRIQRRMGVAGVISAILSHAPNVSDSLHGGFVVYTKEHKAAPLGGGFESAEADPGSVTEEVARQMAQGALTRSAADVALSVTGLLDKTGGQTGGQ